MSYFRDRFTMIPSAPPHVSLGLPSCSGVPDRLRKKWGHAKCTPPPHKCHCQVDELCSFINDQLYATWLTLLRRSVRAYKLFVVLWPSGGANCQMKKGGKIALECLYALWIDNRDLYGKKQRKVTRTTAPVHHHSPKRWVQLTAWLICKVVYFKKNSSCADKSLLKIHLIWFRQLSAIFFYFRCVGLLWRVSFSQTGCQCSTFRTLLTVLICWMSRRPTVLCGLLFWAHYRPSGRFGPLKFTTLACLA